MAAGLQRQRGGWSGLPADSLFTFGVPTDMPVVGDWDGKGRTKIGVFRGGKWYLDINGNGTWNGCVGVIPDKCYAFGLATDTPVTGDWTGDSKTEIGVFRNGLWILDLNGNGAWNPGTDGIIAFGLPTDTPVTGDWDGDGVTEIGVFRAGNWYLDYNGNDLWDGCAVDKCYTFGLATDKPVTGDWTGDGITRIGVFRNGSWYLDYNGNGVWNGCKLPFPADECITFGLATDKPVTGNW